MPLFNVSLKNDEPDEKGNRSAFSIAPARFETWTTEKVVKSSVPVDLGKLAARIQNFRSKFIAPNLQQDFQTEIVIAKQVLDEIMKHPNAKGIRIYLADNDNYNPYDPENRQANNSFIVMAVDSEVKDITEGDIGDNRTNIDAVICGEGTGCPPREPDYCKDSNILFYTRESNK
jgi:hypothetical protein